MAVTYDCALSVLREWSGTVQDKWNQWSGTYNSVWPPPPVWPTDDEGLAQYIASNYTGPNVCN